MTRLILALSMLFSSLSHADTYVKGYYRKNGTYVQPHYRSDRNSSTLDNWSTKGNVNPYTGKVGTRDPYRQNNQQPQKKQSGFGY